MSFFPFLNIPKLDSFVTLHNFPPNNWEADLKGDSQMHLVWLDKDGWGSKCIGSLPYGQSKKILYSEIFNEVPPHQIVLVTLSRNCLPARGELLPHIDFYETRIPEWRATIGILSKNSSCSYQGELNPFLSNRSMLSFSPFFQSKGGVLLKNYLIFINLENTSKQSVGNIEIFRANINSQVLASFEVKNNCINVVCLDDFNLPSSELLIFLSRNVAGIPLYFSSDATWQRMSLEHTHPLTSLFIHGDRYGMQAKIKSSWMDALRK
jgi:hypothetical protein